MNQHISTYKHTKNENSWTQKNTCAYMCSVAVNTLIWVKTIQFRSKQ